MNDRATASAEENAARRRTVRMSAQVVAAFTVALLLWVPFDPDGFARGLGLGASIPARGWLVAGAVVVAYASYTLWAVPETRPVARELSWFRSLAVPLALGSGLVEEMFFRHYVMSILQTAGFPAVAQVLASAALFALVHSVWVLFGANWRTVLPILLSTFGLGVLMALVYLASGRVALPAVVAHAAINLVIEPGLLLSASRAAVAQKRARAER